MKNYLLSSRCAWCLKMPRQLVNREELGKLIAKTNGAITMINGSHYRVRSNLMTKLISSLQLNLLYDHYLYTLTERKISNESYVIYHSCDHRSYYSIGYYDDNYCTRCICTEWQLADETTHQFLYV